MRYRHGAAPGRFNPAITGADDGSYEREVIPPDRTGSLVAERSEGDIAAEDTYEFEGSIP